MNRLPSLVSPFMATKTVPGRTRRESYSTPATPGFPLWERTSAPCRSCWNVIGVIITSRHFYLPKRTVMRDPVATCVPGKGDCSRATPLPMALRSSPASCAASIASRKFLPRKDGTSIPPSSTSKTTVPPAERWFLTWRREGSRFHLSSARICGLRLRPRRTPGLTSTRSAAASPANNRLSPGHELLRDRGLGCVSADKRGLFIITLMTFQQLLQGAEVLSQSGNPAVAGVEYDSRRVRPGTVFVAMKGETSDGNRFIDQAIAAGAVAIVTDSVAE